MVTSGDVVELGLGLPEGSEAGIRHPAVVITAQRILDAQPTVIQVVPLTSTVRRFTSEITIEPDVGNGLSDRSAAQCQHIRAVSTRRVEQARGNVGPTIISRIRHTIGLILDIPTWLQRGTRHPAQKHIPPNAPDRHLGTLLDRDHEIRSDAVTL